MLSIGYSWTRKVLSSVRAYAEQRDLALFLYEKHLAMKFFAAHTRAQRMGITGDVMARSSQTSTGYWEIVQDSLADLVRIMLVRCYDEENHKDLYDHVRGLRGQVMLCAYPNLFITIAPAEWKFYRPYFLEPYLQCVWAGSYLMALHMFFVVRSMWLFLASRTGHKFFKVFEWVMKTEYQGRGTPHWHIAAWVVCYGYLAMLAGRTGTSVVSAFVKFLAALFQCEIDVQVGNGRLNYINGYVSKDHDAVDVGLGEYCQKNATAPWLAAYRLLSKSTPCMPEVAIRLAHLSEWERSYAHVLLYPPQPAAMLTLEGRQVSFSAKMYGAYLAEKRQQVCHHAPITESFLVWHRDRQFDSEADQGFTYRGGRHQQVQTQTLVVACRYWYELTDGYWGQFVLTQIPHQRPEDILPRSGRHLDSMQNFAGMLEYLSSWVWRSEEVIESRSGCLISTAALPLLLDDRGEPRRLGPYAAGDPVFANEREAYAYLLELASRDLQYRGFRDDRVANFARKQEASMLLLQRVRHCADDAEYEMLRQQWDSVNRPQYQRRTWSPRQEEALGAVAYAVSLDDEEQKRQHARCLFVSGGPGSGKSAVLLEMAIRSAKGGLRVLIVCPTGQLVHSFKCQLPEVDGVENIAVDTIHGILGYKRPGPDGKVVWAPPSALRRIDLILVDEASQYDNREWKRLAQSIAEQPHLPYVVAVADFQQLQPVVSGGLCQEMVSGWPEITLDTVYRSSDEQHLLFLTRVRGHQPSREVLAKYRSR